MPNNIDTLISDAITDTSKLLNLLNDYKKKYGSERLMTILSEHEYIEKNLQAVKKEHPLYGAAVELAPDTVDPVEFVKLVKEANEISEKEQKNNDSINEPKTGINESDSLEKFGLYRKLMEREEENRKNSQSASIYSQDPNTLAKIEEDRINHPVIATTSMGQQISSSEFDKTDDERPYTKTLEINNPWSEVGAPVSPGQIKF